MNAIKKNTRLILHGVLLSMLLAPYSAGADDIDVFVNPSLTGVKPNILLLLDLSESMDYAPDNQPPATANDSKIAILKSAMNSILDDPHIAGKVNIGLQIFKSKYSSVGAPIIFPVADPDDDAHNYDPAIPVGTTVRQVLKNQIESAETSGNKTPILNALYESARYFRGMDIDDGSNLVGEAPPVWNQSASIPQYTAPPGSNWWEWWRAPHLASYIGNPPSETVNSETQTLLGTSGSTNQYCYDYSPYGGTNYCQEYNGTPLNTDANWLSCTTYSYDSCSVSFVYSFQDPGNCSVNAPGTSSPWVCGGDSGNNSEFWCVQPQKTSTSSKYCCSETADETGTECKTWSHWPKTQTCPGVITNNSYNFCRFEVIQDTTTTTGDRTYISPIQQACQSSNILLLTDGAPAYQVNIDSGSNSNATTPSSPYRIRQLIADNTAPAGLTDAEIASTLCDDISNNLFGDSTNSIGANCAIELTSFLKSVDQIPSIPDSKVNLHAIAFGEMTSGAKEFLKRLSREPGPGGTAQYHEATSLSSLKQALTEVISTAGADNFSFTGVSISVNSNRLSSNEKTFINVFKPTAERIWPGNSKGYFLGLNGLEDVNRNPATHINLSGVEQFKNSAQSFWSLTADGNEVSEGGLLNKINAATRSMYFTIETDPIPAPGSNQLPVNLTNTPYQLTTSNSDRLTKARMGMPATATDTDQTDLINWVKEPHMGESLHTEPTLVDYGNPSNGADQVLYVATNEGSLHAFDVTKPAPGSTGDTSGGDELFAFMPSEVLHNLYDLKSKTTTGGHLYGIDGPISIWREAGSDNSISATTDHVYLYFGMRRGGRAYYALDVTDSSTPKIKWRIDNTSNGFSKLGQTWSRMSLTDVHHNGGKRKILIFAGGYDEAQDGKTIQSADTTGLGLYIIDADTGELLMSIGPDSTEFIKVHPDMTQSIPSDLRLIDSNGNGMTDRLYVADMGSNLWRIDLDETGNINDANTFNVYKLANLADSTNTEAGNRRFFYPPSVTLSLHGGKAAMALAIGSGFRAQPFNAINQDKFFVIFDEDAKTGKPSSTTTLTLSDLHDMTDNTISDASEQTLFENSHGWFIDLDSHEKVLSESIIFDNKILFSAYQPELNTASACGVSSNALYAIDLGNGQPVIAQDIDTNSPGPEQPPAGTAGKPYRKVSIHNSSIAGSPTLVFLDPAIAGVANGECTTNAQVFSGSEKILSLDNCIHNIFWRESSQ